MAEDAEELDGTEPKKKSKKGLLFGMLLALILGGGGFYAVYSGLVLGSEAAGHSAESDQADKSMPLPDVVFVPVQPLVINVGANGAQRFLRFQAQIEVRRSAEQDVLDVMPRIVDVLNGYLRAVDLSELQERAALVRLRAQMLRRVQVVTGEGRVRDLLIMEFVLN